MGQGPERVGLEADFGALEADSGKYRGINFEEIGTSRGMGGTYGRRGLLESFKGFKGYRWIQIPW